MIGAIYQHGRVSCYLARSRQLLKTKARAHVAVTRENVDSRNLAGIRPGSDRILRKEYVVVSAHLDHLGVGEKVNGDGIFNGFDQVSHRVLPRAGFVSTTLASRALPATLARR